MINLSFMNGKIKESILIRDFLNDRTYVVDAAPGQKTLAAEITHQKSGDKVFSVERVRRGYVLATGPAANSVFVDGKEGNRVDLKVDEDYSVFDGSNLLLIRVTENASAWKKTIEKDTWSITDLHSDKAAGPMPLSDLLESMELFLSEFEAGVVHHSSVSSGFHLKHFAKAHSNNHSESSSAPEPVVPAVAHRSAADEENLINAEYGKYTCPACWLKFDRGDVLHISVHAALKGDPVLGEEEMLRFSATRFSDSGKALDAMGLPVNDMSCPHCRRKLPPSFLDLPQHIFSIVGAPSSGKSYYLAVLVKMLQTSLYKNFNTSFFDADPSENIRLTEMKNKLFSASSSAEASIAKTDLEGDMYLEIPRMGRLVRMPKPFVFNVAPTERQEETVSVVYYDNAGEHFEPTRNSAESPGAQHIASASAIFFIFDPTYNLEFRRRLVGHPDPQITDQRFDQQDTLLAETNARVKNLLAIDFKQKITTPLAVIVNKMDVWQDLVGGRDKFQNPVTPGRLDLRALDANSAIARNLLLEVAPQIVANAEAISSNVRYFPVSSFGCSPERVGQDKAGRPIFSPNPEKLNPVLIEVPTLWVLSLIEPSLVAGIA